jgi:hypothetical protein
MHGSPRAEREICSHVAYLAPLTDTRQRGGIEHLMQIDETRLAEIRR